MSPAHPAVNRPSAADLEAACQAASDCYKAIFFTRTLFDGQPLSVPEGLGFDAWLTAAVNAQRKGAQPTPGDPGERLAEFFKILSVGMQALADGVGRFAAIRRAEPWLMSGQLARVLSVGEAVTAHRLAVEEAARTRNAVWRGLDDALFGELSCAFAKIEPFLARDDDPPPEAADEFKAAAARTVAVYNLEAGLKAEQVHPEAALNLATRWRPGSFAAIQAALGAPPDYRALSNALELEQIRALRATCGTPQSADGPPPPPKRRCRLRIVGKNVLLDGETVPLEITGEAREIALCYLRHVINAQGDWISGPEIDKAEGDKGFSGQRWDRVRKRLPIVLLELTETDRKKGNRLTDAAWRR